MNLKCVQALVRMMVFIEGKSNSASVFFLVATVISVVEAIFAMHAFVVGLVVVA